MENRPQFSFLWMGSFPVFLKGGTGSIERNEKEKQDKTYGSKTWVVRNQRRRILENPRHTLSVGCQKIPFPALKGFSRKSHRNPPAVSKRNFQRTCTERSQKNCDFIVYHRLLFLLSLLYMTCILPEILPTLLGWDHNNLDGWGKPFPGLGLTAIRGFDEMKWVTRQIAKKNRKKK